MADQPQGTEYTLQGVMRFLQMEWHSHERARNAWDIERGELKAKIAKQEGDSRNAKKLNESLDKQIKMLERAIRNERAKTKALAAGELYPSEDEVREEWKSKVALGTDAKLYKDLRPSVSTTAPDSSDVPESELDSSKYKSRQWLQQCVQEFSYLLIPPAHPPPPQSLHSPMAYGEHQETHPSLEEMYLQQRQKSIQPSGLSQLPSLPNHQSHPARSSSEYVSHSSQMQQGALMSRQIPNVLSMQQREPSTANDTSSQQLRNDTIAIGDQEDQVEKVNHTFDSYGQAIRPSGEDVSLPRPLISEDSDGWNFDEYPGPLIEPGPPELVSTRRPDTDLFPMATNIPAKSPPRSGPGSHRRKSSGTSNMARRRSSEIYEISGTQGARTAEVSGFRVRFALRGHLDVVRSIIFTGGGSPSEPEICTAGDDGTVKRWIIPATTYGSNSRYDQPSSQIQQQAGTGQINDLDIQSYFSHRGHEGTVTSLAAYPAPSPSFSTGGRALGDGWVFSGGQDATIRVWERGRVDPKATLEGHTDAVWTLCILPVTQAVLSTMGTVFDQQQDLNNDRILLASGSADGTIKIWAVSPPPVLGSPHNLAAVGGSRRGVGGARRHSVTSGSGFPSSPQPSVASNTPFFYSLIHTISRDPPIGLDGVNRPFSSPTSIVPLGAGAENFVVSFTDAAIVIFDTRTGEEVIGMASAETYDGTPATGVNSIVATGTGGGGFDIGGGSAHHDAGEDEVPAAPTGNSSAGGVEGVIISGHEDRFVRFFDANSGQCTYSMLAHPSAIASLSLSPDGRELVSAGHDASLRFWSMEKRNCVQEITSHRLCRGEGVCCAIWSGDGRWVVAGGGDGVVKVFGR